MPRKKLKIVLLGPSYPFRGGISHHTTLLYENLKKKHNVVFISFLRQYPKFLYPGQTDADPSKSAVSTDENVRIFDSLNPLSWLKTAKRVVKEKPDLFVLPWWVAFFTVPYLFILKYVKKNPEIKILFICHNVVEHESGRLKQICAKLVLKHGDFFIVHSGDDKRNLESIIPEAKVRQTYHPIYDVFKKQSAFLPKNKAKKRLGFSKENNVILFFGFIRPYKGLSYLLNAMANLIKMDDNYNLLIVGEFWKDKKTYFNIIDDLGISSHVKIMDKYVLNEDIPLYFYACDIVAIPYISATGSGIAQMAYGFEKSVVVTDVGALPEIVENGKTGFVVPPKDADKLAEAVIKLFENKIYVEFEKNIKEIKYKFSWDYFSEIIESFLR
ncbi:glycosyltransferase [bacterium]|nr:glycosyltransferase [bacterium]